MRANRGDPIIYPKPDGKLSFDLLSNLQRSGTTHEADQPSHLHIQPGKTDISESISYHYYSAPEQRFCPAGVYEYEDTEPSRNEYHNNKRLVLNSQNCLHCKCCSIKTVDEWVKWTVPEGGGGPNYTVM
jgi:electron-transferring-flavoprotein dehydrogenase